MKINQVLRLTFQIDKSSKMGSVIWNKWGVLSSKARGYLIRELLYGMAASYSDLDFSDTLLAASLAKFLCSRMSPYSTVQFPKGIEKSNGMNKAETIKVDVSINLDTDEGEAIKKLISSMSSKTVGKVIRILLYGAADAFKRLNFEGVSYYEIQQFAKRLSANMCPDIAYRFYNNVSTFVSINNYGDKEYVWHSKLPNPAATIATPVTDDIPTTLHSIKEMQFKPSALADANDVSVDYMDSPYAQFKAECNMLWTRLFDDYHSGRISEAEHERLKKYYFNSCVEDVDFDFLPQPHSVRYLLGDGELVDATTKDGFTVNVTLLKYNSPVISISYESEVEISDIRAQKYTILDKLFDGDIMKMSNCRKEVPLDFKYYEYPDIDTGEQK